MTRYLYQRLAIRLGIAGLQADVHRVAGGPKYAPALCCAFWGGGSDEFLGSCENRGAGRIIKKVKPRIFPAILLLAAVLALYADTKPFSPPAANHAKTYPAHESHDDEKVSIAIDPYDLPDKAKIFKTNYQEKGFLPIRLIISNDSDQTIMLTDLKIEYITVKRDKIEPATTDDIYRRIVHLKRNPSSQRTPIPLPIPRGSGSPVSKDAKQAMEELDAAQFIPYPIEPHAIRSGFLFFDISGIEVPEAGAHVYLTGMTAGGKELFYFDIPLEKYLSYQPGK
jgi:hypothetical protein